MMCLASVDVRESQIIGTEIRSLKKVNMMQAMVIMISKNGMEKLGRLKRVMKLGISNQVKIGG